VTKPAPEPTPDASPRVVRPTLHLQIRSNIEKQILSGAWKPGHRIPFEHELVQQYGCSRMTVNKAIGELVNVGPMEYLNQCRLDRAAKQLQEQPQRSVTEIAFANGFNSSQYFATCFRQRYKMSPSRFVLEQRGSKSVKS